MRRDELAARKAELEARIAAHRRRMMQDAREWREAVRSTGATWVHPHHRDLSRATVRLLHAEGLGVNTWTVNDRGRSRKLAAWGVRGMCTDGPERVIRQFARIPAGRHSA